MIKPIISLSVATFVVVLFAIGLIISLNQEKEEIAAEKQAKIETIELLKIVTNDGNFKDDNSSLYNNKQFIEFSNSLCGKYNQEKIDATLAQLVKILPTIKNDIYFDKTIGTPISIKMWHSIQKEDCNFLNNIKLYIQNTGDLNNLITFNTYLLKISTNESNIQFMTSQIADIKELGKTTIDVEVKNQNNANINKTNSFLLLNEAVNNENTIFLNIKEDTQRIKESIKSKYAKPIY
jgi:hypothetical protein